MGGSVGLSPKVILFIRWFMVAGKLGFLLYAGKASCRRVSERL